MLCRVSCMWYCGCTRSPRTVPSHPAVILESAPPNPIRPLHLRTISH